MPTFDPRAGLAAAALLLTAAVPLLGLAADAPPRAVTAADLGCLQGWAEVGHTRYARVGGDVAETLAVARGGPGGSYPPGSILQLMPTEAMVKLAPGASPDTDDWEYLKLEVKRGQTVIAERGGREVKNIAGGCADCHGAAKAYESVCGADHGCKPLPAFIVRAALKAVANDPRCLGVAR